MWLTAQGARVSKPIGHCPDYDLIADFGDRMPGRGEDVHVVPPRTMGHVHLHARWEPELERTCVVLGSRSLRLPFVHVLDGRRWFTHLPPSRYGTSSCSVGRNTPSSRSSRVRRFPAQTDDRQASTIASRQLGGMPERSNGSGCKPDGYAYAGSNPAPPTNVGKPLDKRSPPRVRRRRGESPESSELAVADRPRAQACHVDRLGNASSDTFSQRGWAARSSGPTAWTGRCASRSRSDANLVPRCCAQLAQLVEHLHGKEGVVGSSPTLGSCRKPRKRGCCIKPPAGLFHAWTQPDR
jgi:hypothetical protein